MWRARQMRHEPVWRTAGADDSLCVRPLAGDCVNQLDFSENPEKPEYRGGQSCCRFFGIIGISGRWAVSA
jgi:hypothetical protein